MSENKERNTSRQPGPPDNGRGKRARNRLRVIPASSRRDLEFEIRTDNSKQTEQRRKCSDPKSDLLEAGGFDRDDVPFEAGFLVRSTIESTTLPRAMVCY